MNAFIVDLNNKPGELAKVTEAISTKGINLTGLSAATCGDTGTVVLLTNDEAGTKRALSEANYKAREIELVTASLADKPGAFADAARRLASAGVNIEAVVPTEITPGRTIHVAFVTDNPSKAKSVLGETVSAGSFSR